MLFAGRMVVRKIAPIGNGRRKEFPEGFHSPLADELVGVNGHIEARHVDIVEIDVYILYGMDGFHDVGVAGGDVGLVAILHLIEIQAEGDLVRPPPESVLDLSPPLPRDL